MLSDHGRIKLETNNGKISGKSSNTWRLNNTFPNNRWIKGDISRKVNINVKTAYQDLGCSESRREVYSIEHIHYKVKTF